MESTPQKSPARKTIKSFHPIKLKNKNRSPRKLEKPNIQSTQPTLLSQVIPRQIEEHQGQVALPKPGEPLPTLSPKTKPPNSTNNSPYEIERSLIEELTGLRQESKQNFKVTKQTTTNPTPKEIEQGLKKLSVGYRQEANIIQKLQILRNQTGNPYRRQDLPPFIDKTTLYPSKVNLERTTKFGKSNIKKSFTVTPDTGALA
jgi:hypothetical protein